MTAENLLKDFLKLDTRKDYREFNKGNDKQINLNDRTDLAYIRCQFKRWLLNNQPKQLKLYTDYSNGYNIITENNKLDFSQLKDRNKVINRINLALTEIAANNEKVFGLR